MLRFAPVIIEILLLVYCLIDCIQTPEGEIRNLPKVFWILLIVVVPFVGAIAWLVAGRPQSATAGRAPWSVAGSSGRPGGSRGGPPTRSALGPDDDPDFLRNIGSQSAGNLEQEQLLKRWEEDLRKREEKLRDEPEDPQAPAPR